MERVRLKKKVAPQVHSARTVDDPEMLARIDALFQAGEVDAVWGVPKFLLRKYWISCR